MSSVPDHYAQLLAPIYLWMAGGAEAALAAGSAELEALGLPLRPGDEVVDLGAGFGLHAIPLARRGARVTAIDASEELLRTLERLAGELPIRRVRADLRDFAEHVTTAPAAILCMGDTLVHLPDVESVERLVRQAARALAPDGAFVITLRDHSTPLTGEQRFLPVRSDADRILTCFLEYEPEHVVVHDVVHERGAAGWSMRVSAYRKLRLSPAWLVLRLEAEGLAVRREAGVRGMVRLVAQRRA